MQLSGTLFLDGFYCHHSQPFRLFFIAASPSFRKKKKPPALTLIARLTFSVLCCQLPSLGLDQIRHRRLANPTDLPCAAASALLCAPVFFRPPSSAYTSPYLDSVPAFCHPSRVLNYTSDLLLKIGEAIPDLFLHTSFKFQSLFSVEIDNHYFYFTRGCFL